MRRAAYRLALELGWFNVDAMLATGEPRHLAEWQEYEDLEPFGQPWKRESLMTTRTINTIISAVPRSGSEEPEFYEDDAFVPKREDAEKVNADTAAQCAAADSIEGLGV